MPTTRRRHATVALTVLVVLLAVGSGQATAMHTQTGRHALNGTIIIGQVTSLTGPFSVYGIMEEQGFHLGLEYATHGTMKINGVPIVVKEFNDASGSSGLPHPAAAVSPARDAIQSDHAQNLQCCASRA